MAPRGNGCCARAGVHVVQGHDCVADEDVGPEAILVESVRVCELRMKTAFGRVSERDLVEVGVQTTDTHQRIGCGGRRQVSDALFPALHRSVDGHAIVCGNEVIRAVAAGEAREDAGETAAVPAKRYLDQHSKQYEIPAHH